MQHADPHLSCASRAASSARSLALAAGLILAAWPALAAAPDGDIEKGFTPLFDGRGLDGWVVEGKRTCEQDGKQVPIWSVEEGMILCQGNGYGFLRYDKEFQDCILRLEYRMTKGCNSGIGIRTVPYTGKGGTRPSRAGYEMQILDDAGRKPGTHSSGSLYRYVAPRVNASRPAGEWNALEIELRGPHVKLTLNGQVIHDLDQSKIDKIKNKPVSGYFCLQNHGKKIAFRNIRVKER